MANATAAQRRFWTDVAAMGCIVCARDAEIAHCHGGSIVERMKEPKAKGKKLQRYNWLVIPLCPSCHRLGLDALDLNVQRWERRHGAQSDHIDWLSMRLRLPLWDLAKRA